MNENWFLMLIIKVEGEDMRLFEERGISQWVRLDMPFFMYLYMKICRGYKQ